MAMTIKEFSEKCGFSPKAIRFYESKGLISPSYIDHRTYRYFGEEQIKQAARIDALKKIGFTLREIQELILGINEIGFQRFQSLLHRKLQFTETQIDQSLDQKRIIERLLTMDQPDLNLDQVVLEISHQAKRRLVMDLKEVFNKEIIELKGQSQTYLAQLKREERLFDTQGKKAFMMAIRETVAYAEEQKIRIGFVRGGASSSLILHWLGVSGVNPIIEGLFPERWVNGEVDFWFDVQHDRWDEIKAFTEQLSKNLSFGKLTPFKSPFLQVVENCHQQVGCPAVNPIEEETLLEFFRSSEIEYLYAFDMRNSLMDKLYGWSTWQDFKHIFSNIEIRSYQDVMNLESIYIPQSPHSKERLAQYLEATKKPLSYRFLPKELNDLLVPNYGMILYQEDIISIIRYYTGWGYERCDQARRTLGKGYLDDPILKDLKQICGSEVLALLANETPLTFSKAHLLSERDLVRKSAALKYWHFDVYLKEIEKFEQKTGLSWSEMGFKNGEISVLC